MQDNALLFNNFYKEHLGRLRLGSTVWESAGIVDSSDFASGSIDFNESPPLRESWIPLSLFAPVLQDGAMFVDLQTKDMGLPLGKDIYLTPSFMTVRFPFIMQIRNAVGVDVINLLEQDTNILRMVMIFLRVNRDFFTIPLSYFFINELLRNSWVKEGGSTV